MSLKQRMRSMQQGENNFFNLVAQSELPRIKQDLQENWKKEQQEKKKIKNRIRSFFKKIWKFLKTFFRRN